MGEKMTLFMATAPIPPKTPDRAMHPMVSTPLRSTTPLAAATGLQNLFAGIATSLPELKRDLAIAEMPFTPAQFVQIAFTQALMISIALTLVTLMAVQTLNFDLPLMVASVILSFLLLFLIAMQFTLYAPRVRIRARGRAIDQELVFAGRHLLIELRSGVALFDAMLGVSRDYGEVSKEFNRIVEKITLGVPVAVAMHEVADHAPSAYFRRVVLQMANAMASGSDVADSLDVVLGQISQEQIIQLKAYGQKLNPLVMFYMLFGVIIPSLGVAFLIILLSFIGSGLSAYGVSLLAGILGLVTIIQFLFLSIVENSRPSFDLT
jgi:flagellar protein FlaJ